LVDERVDYMEYTIPRAAALSLTAFLRQAALSIDRAQSISELTSFFRDRSVDPKLVRLAFSVIVRGEHVAASPHWPALFKCSNSILYAVAIRIKTTFTSKSVMVISRNEVAAILEALSSLDELLHGTGTPQCSALNVLRYQLNTCAELLLLRTLDKQSRTRIQMVEHLNSAPHLHTVSIYAFPRFWEQLTQ